MWNEKRTQKIGKFMAEVALDYRRAAMETDIEGLIGAGRYERNGELTIWRNGYRDRTLDTRL
jgi:transposase-like protein